MSTESEIVAHIAEAQADYHEVAQSGKESEAKLRERTEKIKALRVDLSAVMSQGAEACPGCGNPPLGMRKNPHEVEIGCLSCKPEVVKPAERGGPRLRKDPRARGGTVEDAVARWNAGERLILTETV